MSLHITDNISILVNNCRKALLDRGLSKSTLANYTTVLNNFVSYCKQNKIKDSTTDVSLEFLITTRNIDKKEIDNQIGDCDKFYLLTINILDEFNKTGLIFYRYNNNKIIELNKVNLENFFQFSDYLRTLEFANSSIKSHCLDIKPFLSFLEANHISSIDQLNNTIIFNYIKSITAMYNSYIRKTIASIKLFINYLKSKKYMTSSSYIYLPNIKVQKQARISSVWKHDDVIKLLDSIDRNNSIGKRNYAIIFLAAGLGIRSIDIKNLSFNNINWEKKIIEFNQSKTKRLVTLPLLPDVGWALIDYIKKGRPASNEKTIFVRHNPPFCKFTDETSLHYIINRQIQLAGINSENQKRGLHSLRHTLATLLFESNIPIEDITSILGHKSSNSTPTYIKTSINMLKTCCNDDELI